MAAGAALGALKNSDDKKAAAEQNKVEAVKELWSPWTGVHSKGNQKTQSLMGDLGQGAISGLAMGQSFKNAEKADTQGASSGLGAVDSDFNKYGGGGKISDSEAMNLWSRMTPEQQEEIAAKARGR